jgi:hypothetical protein
VIAIDRRVVQGPVVYCAFEGGGDYSTRAEAFRQRYLPEDTESLHFYLLDTQIGSGRRSQGNHRVNSLPSHGVGREESFEAPG